MRLFCACDPGRAPTPGARSSSAAPRSTLGFALAWLALGVGCRPDPEPTPPSSPAIVSEVATASVSTARPASASATALAGAANAASGALAASASAAPIELTEAERALGGKTIDFEYDGKELKDRARAYSGRIFVHERALSARRKLPLVVFFHGLNKALIPHRWMGGGDEGDVRKISAALMREGKVAPFVLAGPGSVQKEAVSSPASFPQFDLRRFVELVDENLGDVEIDREQIVIVGHSGAGCSAKGGIVSGLELSPAPLAIVSIDTCMGASLAQALGGADPRTHVVVTWQASSWPREFDAFQREFKKVAAKHPKAEETRHVLEELPSLAKPHDATVKQTFDKHLPILLRPAP